MIKTIKIICFLIAVILFIEFIDYFRAVLDYPNNIFIDEGILSRISLSIMANGLRFTTLDVYPHILTMYGFLYELVSLPFFYLMEPTVNCGRYVSFASSLIIIVLLYKMLRKMNLSSYLAFILSMIFLLYKPTAAYGCYSKSDSFATLLTLVVLYSLYFHRGNKQFIVTLIFSSLALTTKQTTAFIVPVVLVSFIIQKTDKKEFFRALKWMFSFILIFAALFLAIQNYFYNTVTLTLYLGTLYTSMEHLLTGQVFPLIRATIFFMIIPVYAIIKNKIKIKELLSPSVLYLLFYIPIFLMTSYSTASEVVYFMFIFPPLAVFLGEMIIKYNLKERLFVHLCILIQLVILLLYPSKVDALKFTYIKPTSQMKNEAAEIESIIKNAGVERSFVTFSWSSFGLSKESAGNLLDFKLGYLIESGKLNPKPYLDDFDKKRFSVIVGGLDLPQLHEGLLKNYYLYKVIGNTPVYLPKKE